MATASLKVHHVRKGTNRGIESADFRGDKFIGHEQGDEHETIWELQLSANLTPEEQALVDLWIQDAPAWNRMNNSMFGGNPFAGKLKGILGKIEGISLGGIVNVGDLISQFISVDGGFVRAGVWDN